MPKSSCKRWVRILVVLLGRLHVYFFGELIMWNFVEFLMFGLEKGTA